MSTITGSSAATPSSLSSVPPVVDALVTRCKPYVEAYSSFRAAGKRVREVMKTAHRDGHAFPQNDKGIDMCVSYHVKGVCNSNCGRAANHSPHSPEETARLLEWCGLAFGT
jgi:hypothetical protein